MTIGELVRKKVLFYKRCDWTEGQYAHIDYLITAGEDGPPTGAQVCFCSAPFAGNDPRADDDLWMAYDGPESRVSRTLVPVQVVDSPEGLLDLLRELGVVAVKPEVPSWQVSQGMRA